MIFITATFSVKPEHADQWPQLSAAFTRATRAEAGCLWFEGSRFLDDPAHDVLIEAFRDGEAGGAHVQSPHLDAQRELPPYLASTPQIVNLEVPGVDWSRLGEMQVDAAS